MSPKPGPNLEPMGRRDSRKILRTFHIPMLVVAVGVLILPVVAYQYVFGAQIVLALAGLWCVGRAVMILGQRIMGSSAFAGMDQGGLGTIFFTILLGQIASHVLFLVASPVLYPLLSYLPINNKMLIFTTILGIASLWIIRQHRHIHAAQDNGQEGRQEPDALYLLIMPATGIFCMVKVAMQFSFTLGDLGMDTHQHIYWATHIMDAGYLPLTARHTGLLEAYSKGLHTTAALYAGFGFCPAFVGVLIKCMPYFQGALAGMAAMEILMVALRSRIHGRAWTCFARLFMAIFFVLATLVYTQMVYPVSDLNHTGGISSATCFMAPVLFALYAGLRRDSWWAGMALVMLPISFALVIKFNPATAVPFLVMNSLVVLLLILPWMLRSLFMPFRFRRWLWTAGLTGYLGLADPFALNALTQIAPGPMRQALTMAGISERDQPANNQLEPSQTACNSPACYLARLENAAIKGLSSYPSLTIAERPFPAVAFTSPVVGERFYQLIYLAAGAALALMVATWFIYLKSGRSGLLPAFPVGCFLAVLVGYALGHVNLRFFFDIYDAVLDKVTMETHLISLYGRGYTRWLSMHLFTLLIPLAVVCVILQVAELRALHGSISRSDAGAVRGPGVLQSRFFGYWCPLLMTGLMAILVRLTPLTTDGRIGWGPTLSYKRLQKFRELEARIPAGDRILVDSAHHMLSGQHWLLPHPRISPYLALGRRQFVFDVQLGAGYAYSWIDYNERICQATPEVRSRYLQEHGIRWIFVGTPAEKTDAYLQDHRICGLSLRDFGVTPGSGVYNDERTLVFFPLNFAGE